MLKGGRPPASGLTSVTSGMRGFSSQSAGFTAAGSLMVFGARKSHPS